MKLKELRIRNFAGITKADLRLEDQSFVLIGGSDHDFPCDPENDEGKSLIFDALDWVLFGNARQDPGCGEGVMARSVPNGCSVQLDFDDYSVHRTFAEGFPGFTLRLFKYDPNPFCSVTTVKEMTGETTDAVQKLIEDAIGFSEFLQSSDRDEVK
jgi:DNA repair exonuclease SbcCD ATPase subunit